MENIINVGEVVVDVVDADVEVDGHPEEYLDAYTVEVDDDLEVVAEEEVMFDVDESGRMVDDEDQCLVGVEVAVEDEVGGYSIDLSNSLKKGFPAYLLNKFTEKKISNVFSTKQGAPRYLTFLTLFEKKNYISHKLIAVL